MSKCARTNAMVPCKWAPITVRSPRLSHGEEEEILFAGRLGGRPNYYRNSYNGPEVTDRERHLEHATFESGMAGRHEDNDDDNFSQARDFYLVKESFFEQECVYSRYALPVLESIG